MANLATLTGACTAMLLGIALIGAGPLNIRSDPTIATDGRPAVATRFTVLIPTAAQRALPTAEVVISALAQRAVVRLNDYRRLAGLPAVAGNPLLTRAAENHAQYYVLNFGDPTLQDLGLHRETEGQPGFTGAEPKQRAARAGYLTGKGMIVDENVGLVGHPERLIDAFVDTVNHRWNMLHPSLVDIGYGAATDPRIDVLDLGFRWNWTVSKGLGRYPGPDQTDVPTSSYIWETPDPAPGAPRPLGYPITITFPLSSRVSFTSAELRTLSGEPVEFVSTQKAWLRGLSVIPKRPLQAGTHYIVTVHGSRDGSAFRETWSFTTEGSLP